MKNLDVNANKVTINGVEYIQASDVVAADKLDNMKYVIVRTYSAGVFAGYLKKRDGKEVELVNARRIYYWSGAASLSQLAMEGTKDPSNCKFPCEVTGITLTEAIEILDVTKTAQESIKKVKIWQM